jgi:regulator of protease activity HflC (stomatin/prohibitin superfamily)
MNMKTEIDYKASSGYLMVAVVLLLIAAAITGTAVMHQDWMLILFAPAAFLAIGLLIINPNESSVLILFGEYKGTVKENGFFWVNPFFYKKKISLRAHNFDSQTIKVNDKIGNPILIGVVLVWKVENTYKAAFEVDKYEEFVKVQSESAVRKLAGTYPYDSHDDDETDISLRSAGNEVNEMLESELKERLEIAGIRVMEARISNLAYASEIAGAMLQRQQATAVVAARSKIVYGAVNMVEMALEMLSEKQIVELDEEKKAAMVSNLMVVLCSDKSAAPVVNTGTLHH